MPLSVQPTDTLRNLVDGQVVPESSDFGNKEKDMEEKDGESRPSQQRKRQPSAFSSWSLSRRNKKSTNSAEPHEGYRWPSDFSRHNEDVTELGEQVPPEFLGSSKHPIMVDDYPSQQHERKSSLPDLSMNFQKKYKSVRPKFKWSVGFSGHSKDVGESGEQVLPGSLGSSEYRIVVEEYPLQQHERKLSPYSLLSGSRTKEGAINNRKKDSGSRRQMKNKQKQEAGQ